MYQLALGPESIEIDKNLINFHHVRNTDTLMHKKIRPTGKKLT